MFLNLLHRVTPGKMYPYFKLQQEYAHALGLKVTLMVQLDAMYDDAIISDLKMYHAQYGDELGISLSGFNCSAFQSLVGGDEDFIWLYSAENKRKIINLIAERYHQVFGAQPVSAAAYHLDSVSISILKEICPSIKIAVAGCFEEGVKVFHGCNNSWYLFNEGMPWGPWYPAKNNSLRPAFDENDAAGIIAVPHLSRDLALSYEGRNDFFASHPANAQRGLANEGLQHPYDYNLVDMYRLQEDFNNGFAYYHVYVSPGWLAGHPTIQDPNEVSQQLYKDLLQYFIDLRSQGKLIDQTMSEFASWYSTHIPIGQAEVYLAKEMLYGSKKHYFWYIDPHFRILIDANQGGSIGDLRPYCARWANFTGTDSPSLIIGSYPYVIQSQYRSGVSHHYMDGARTTLLVSDGIETLDLCSCRTRIDSIHRDDSGTYVTLSPARLKFSSGLYAEVITTYHFPGNGSVFMKRSLDSISDSNVTLYALEVFKGCYGKTEYPEDMHGIFLSVEGKSPSTIPFEYRSRTLYTSQATALRAQIPQINTDISLSPLPLASTAGYVKEGILFNPYYTLTLEYEFSFGKDLVTCLQMKPIQ